MAIDTKDVKPHVVKHAIASSTVSHKALFESMAARRKALKDPNTPTTATQDVVLHCPKYLTDRARRIWRKFLPLIAETCVLTSADSIALGNLCQAYASMIEAQLELNRDGMVVISASTGWKNQHPLVSVVQQQMKIVNALCAQFGLTPVARNRMKLNLGEVKDSDEWGDF